LIGPVQVIQKEKKVNNAYVKVT